MDKSEMRLFGTIFYLGFAVWLSILLSMEWFEVALINRGPDLSVNILNLNGFELLTTKLGASSEVPIVIKASNLFVIVSITLAAANALALYLEKPRKVLAVTMAISVVFALTFSCLTTLAIAKSPEHAMSIYQSNMVSNQQSSPSDTYILRIAGYGYRPAMAVSQFMHFSYKKPLWTTRLALVWFTIPVIAFGIFFRKGRQRKT